MRNLQVLREESVNLKVESEREGEIIVAATYDVDHARYFLASDACTVYSINLAGQDQWATSLLEDESDGSPAVLKEPDRIICMEFLLEKEALVLGLAAGDILQLDPSSHQVEVVGAVEGGIVNLVLSPDGELLVVATGLGQLLLMTQDWDVLYEISLDQSLGSSRPGLIPPGDVQISWRGDGKYFSTLEAHNDLHERLDTTSSIKVWERESGALHSSGEPLTYLEPALSWSPAGARIATACCRPGTRESPVVVLFERNGLKRSSFEILAPAEAKIQSLQWNANSELLAILISCGGSDFVQVWNISNFHWYLKQEWRFSTAEKVKMFWDPEKPLHLLCWTQFGCLQRITLCWKSAVLGCSTAFVIDGSNLLITPLSLSIIPPPMFLFKVKFASPVQTVTSLFESTGRCLIAAGLSDGLLGVTILPGVESWDDLEGREIPALSLMSDPVLNFGKLRHISWMGPKTLVGAVFCDVEASKEVMASTGIQTVCPASNVSPGRESLVELTLLDEEGPDSVVDKNSAVSEKWILRLVNQTLLDHPVIAIAASPLNSSLTKTEARKAEAFIQLADGSVVLYSSDFPLFGWDNRKLLQSRCNTVPFWVKFASPSPWMQVISHDNLLTKSHIVLIGLDEQGRLQVNGQLVSSDCTSFTLHESIAGVKENKVTHLVFTTTVDAMHVINLEEILAGGILGEELNISGSSTVVKLVDQPTTLVGKSRARVLKGVSSGIDSLRVRPMWERGARLLTTIGGRDVAVILQTIRGNLETICPRGLVLGAIATALTQENFEDAVLLARRHHINLNVIIDYKGWEQFSQVAYTFVKQVRSLGHVTEVVQAVSKENVMETTYKNLIPVYQKVNSTVERPQAELSDDKKSQVKLAVLEKSKGSKVNAVLSAIRSALQEGIDDSPARELCILTTLARSDPPELEAALERIKALREAEIKGINEGDISSVKGNLSAEAAVKHLIWLTDADIVFSVALGLYDLHLAAMVASHSQRDPKEFLPLLEELGNMPVAQMRYNIDCRLGHFESALRNCADMGNDHFATCIQLIRANPSLFTLGLQIFKDGEKRTAVLDSWGDHLVEESKFEDAGATFCSCFQFDKALDAYRLGGMWESVMTMAGRLGKTPSETLELAMELRDELQAMGRPREAAKLALDYCRDIDGAISLLLDAHEWLEVARLAYLHDKRDKVNIQLEPAVLESASTQLRELDEGVEKVGKYLTRFLAIHQRRVLLTAKLKNEKQGQEKIDNDDASSDISLASSTHSDISGLSGLSAYIPGSRRTQSTTSSVSGKGGRRQARVHKPQGGKIRAGSPGEELALVEHLKGMALSRNSLEENRLLLQALLQLGHESTARRLQQAMSRFIAVQQDSIRQTEEKLLEETSDKQLTGQNNGESGRSFRGNVSKDSVEGAQDVHWQWEILK